MGRPQNKTYAFRKEGKEYCNTEGSSHYKQADIEPMDLTIALGYGEGFCAGSMIKYAARFKTTRNLEDLKKVADYAHILVGIELDKRGDKDATEAGLQPASKSQDSGHKEFSYKQK